MSEAPGKKIGLALAALAVLFLLLELATRLLSDVGPSLTVPDREVGRRYVAGYDGSVYVPEAGRRVRLRFHRDGFRGPDVPYEKGADVRRVAVIGDSFVLAAGVDEERTMVGVLQAMLQAWDPAHRWQVMNFGVSAASTGQELVLYRRLVRRYRPEVVVCAFAVINDLADNSPRITDSAAVYFDLDSRGGLVRLPDRAGAAGASSWLDRHSRFYVWHKLALRKLRFHLRERARLVKPGKLIFSTASDSGDLDHAWTLTARLIETFAREVEADGARFVLAVIPAPEQIYDDRWRQVLHNAAGDAPSFDREHPGRRLAAIAAASGATLVSMTDRFRAHAPSASLAADGEQLFLSGIGHLDETGNRLAAEAIFDLLTDDR